tara:strand:+ start:117 stop:566 length:450 start_codon:yes stop_codon:yes gene_type:complete
MSTLLADTIRKTGGSLGVDIRIKNTSVFETDGGTSVTQNVVQGLAKQWLYFDMASTTAIDSFNNSSLTDDATGKFVANIANDFANTSFVVSYQGNAYADDTFNANTTCIAKLNYVSGSFATGTYDIISYGGSALVDGKYNYCVAHGDLA